MIVLVSIIDFFCVILIDKISLVSATRSRVSKSMIRDSNLLVWKHLIGKLSYYFIYSI